MLYCVIPLSLCWLVLFLLQQQGRPFLSSSSVNTKLHLCCGLSEKYNDVILSLEYKLTFSNGFYNKSCLALLIATQEKRNTFFIINNATTL